ncbi:phosphoserine phosphatase [Salmonella enterica]|nr:phosphoserine phosphatase [Salmonella enterica]
MPNITWCDLPEDVSLWPGLPLSLSGDEVMPLDYHAGRSGWLLYGRGLDKQRLTQYQTKLGAAMVIVAAWCVEDYQVIRLAGSLTPRATRLAHEAQLDVAPLGKIPHLRTPGLLVMDMDSTAIQIECIDEIAKLAGTGEKVAEVTERAMRGELDFTASLRSRVATLKGADADILRQVRGNLPLMPGLTQLVLKLEALGWKIAIASGGFTFFADYLRDQLRLTAAVANELEIMDGKFTGHVIGDIVDAEYKANTLLRLAQEHDIPLAQTVAIGDGANDLPMIKAAGLGIAFHAKPKVNEKTEIPIRHADLMGVFCILSGSMNQK